MATPPEARTGPVLALMGPTAAGKTGLAVDLVQRYPLEIISVDSALVYCDMNIGTAKPDAATLELAPHRLVDILDPAQRYSAADFCRDATEAIGKIHAAGKIPLLVGGTRLYFHALLNGLAEMPEADPELRAALEEQAQQHGWPALHRQLAAVDPQAAAQIEPADRQRIQRALEVWKLTGKPLSQLQQEGQYQTRYRGLKLVVCPVRRSTLHERIERRFRQMLELGFMEEMQALFSRPDLGPDLPSMRSVAYRQGWRYLSGQCSRAAFAEQTLAATRQLAKRQLNWLRHEPATLWYDFAGTEVKCRIFNKVEQFLEMRV